MDERTFEEEIGAFPYHEGDIEQELVEFGRFFTLLKFLARLEARSPEKVSLPAVFTNAGIRTAKSYFDQIIPTELQGQFKPMA